LNVTKLGLLVLLLQLFGSHDFLSLKVCLKVIGYEWRGRWLGIMNEGNYGRRQWQPRPHVRRWTSRANTRGVKNNKNMWWGIGRISGTKSSKLRLTNGERK
jgi:hypothetical protein